MGQYTCQFYGQLQPYIFFSHWVWKSATFELFGRKIGCLAKVVRQAGGLVHRVMDYDEQMIQQGRHLSLVSKLVHKNPNIKLTRTNNIASDKFELFEARLNVYWSLLTYFSLKVFPIYRNLRVNTIIKLTTMPIILYNSYSTLVARFN